jgi:hypothetical protein
LCKQDAPLKSRLGHWLACPRRYLNFLGPAPEKYRNIVLKRTSQALPLILFPKHYVLTIFAFEDAVHYFILAASLNKPPNN